MNRHLLPRLPAMLIALAVLPGIALADRSDSSKPMDFKSQSAHIDDLRKTEGH